MGEDLGHVVYRGPEGETTVWDDVQRRFGNKPPLPEKFVPRAYAPEEDRGLRAAVERDGRAGGVAHVDAAGGTDALEAMEDEDAFADDGFLEEYRRKRLEEMKTAAAIKLLEEREQLTAQCVSLKAKKDKLEGLCRALQKQTLSGDKENAKAAA